MLNHSPTDFPQGAIEHLFTLPSRASQRRYLAEIVARLGDGQAGELAEALRERFIQATWGDLKDMLWIADLVLDLARLTGDELNRALGLRLRAQAFMFGQGNYQKALRLFQRALGLHKKHGDVIGQAMVCQTYIWALANLGRYEQAIETGQWAAKVLLDNNELRPFATVQNNLATVYNRSWEYDKALQCLEKAREAYEALGEVGLPYLANNHYNRALSLSALGRFKESIQVSNIALQFALELGQKVVYARAQHGLATTYFLMGQYNRSLDLLIKAREAHSALGQPHEAALCELSSTDCLLELNRIEAALEKCRQVQPLFTSLGMRLEAAETAHNEAVAFLRLGRLGEAIGSLQAVRTLFKEENLPNWIALTDMEIALVHLRSGRPSASLELVRSSISVLERLGLPYETASARLVAAHALLDLGNLDGSRSLLEQVLKTAEAEDWPALTFQARRLLGRSLLSSGALHDALTQYRSAIEALERLRGQVMLEFRSGFLEDRETVYSEIVSLCLDLSDPLLALEYVERSRSQALLDLLSGKVDLGIRARDPADRPLVEQIERLQSERQLYMRRLDFLWLDVAPRSDAESAQLRDKILDLEKGITDLWHQLLIRNAAYEGDVVLLDTGLWEELSAPLRLDLLEEDALLLEYFPLGECLALFLAGPGPSPVGEPVRAVRLPICLSEVEKLIQALLLNLRAVPLNIQAGGPRASDALEVNARGLLSRLFTALLGPVAEELAGVRRLVIVPHGALHYLPFHALVNDKSYLVETHSLRYLPAAAFLQLGKEKHTPPYQMLAVGHSFGGSLPYTLKEASEVAQLWNAQPLLENSATLETLRGTLGEYDLLHLACHGDFRPDNPLFSGLALEDGWLTTLDLFNLRMRASLVTLSACQTGRSVVGGGDELSGLMRACLSAGATSLALSLWPVADQSAAILMKHFYRALALGEDKASSLRQAQLSLLKGEGEAGSSYHHPYFWAPFYLVGDGGCL